MVTVSLCMILKNEEEFIGKCLESVHDLVDEIIIVDTGSTDKTKEIVSKYTDKIYDFEWVKHFAKARNFSFSKASMEYILWLDADDHLKEADRQRFRNLKETLSPDVNSVRADYDYAFDKDGNVTMVLERERLVKREANPLWQGAIHEIIYIEGKTIKSDFRVSHGRVHVVDPSRNLDIFEHMIANGEELSPRDKSLYGHSLFNNRRYEDSIKQFEEYLNEGKGWADEYIRVCNKLARAYLQVSDEKSALRAYFRSFEYDAPRPEACCGIGKHFFDKKRNTEALYWYETALNVAKRETSGVKDVDCHGYLPGIYLGCIYWRLGEPKKAFEYNEIGGKYKPTDKCYLDNKAMYAKRLEELEKSL